MTIKYTILPIVASVLLTGCGASGMANAMMQKAASNAISSSQENARMKNVQRQAVAQANHDGDNLLTCDEISAQLAEEAVMMASAAEDLGIEDTALSDHATTNAAISQMAMKTGMAKAVPFAGMASGMVAQEKLRQEELRKNAAEAQFYGSKARRDVLVDLSAKADCS